MDFKLLAPKHCKQIHPYFRLSNGQEYQVSLNVEFRRYAEDELGLWDEIDDYEEKYIIDCFPGIPVSSCLFKELRGEVEKYWKSENMLRECYDLENERYG